MDAALLVVRIQYDPNVTRDLTHAKRLELCLISTFLRTLSGTSAGIVKHLGI